MNWTTSWLAGSLTSIPAASICAKVIRWSVMVVATGDPGLSVTVAEPAPPATFSIVLPGR